MASLSTLLKSLPAWAAVALAAASYPAKPRDLSTPVHQHIALNGPHSMSVAWSTYARPQKACVRYGTSEDRLTSEVCSHKPSHIYEHSRTWFQDVTLVDLKPATKYFYQIVSTNSTVETFLSPRFPGDKTPFAMNCIIDLGVVGPDGFTVPQGMSKRDVIPHIDPALNHSTIQRLAETADDYEFIIHPGDFAYADNWGNKAKNVFDGVNAYQAILEQFYGQLAPIASRKPYMGSPGNHEAACFEIAGGTDFCPKGQRNFTDFMARFGNMPSSYASMSASTKAKALANKAQALSQAPFWYSVEYGMVHVTMIDTETDFPDAPDQPGGNAGLNSGPFGRLNQQLEFLEADLASVDRKVTPWLIVAGHRPWYTAAPEAPCESCQAFFESILYKYGVDLVVQGHVHNSQRFFPNYNFTLDPAGMKDPKAPMYIIAGGPGNIEGLVINTDPPAGNITAFSYDADFSYATLKFLDAQNLQIDYIRSATGEVLDSSTLFKSHKHQFVLQSVPK